MEHNKCAAICHTLSISSTATRPTIAFTYQTWLAMVKYSHARGNRMAKKHSAISLPNWNVWIYIWCIDRITLKKIACNAIQIEAILLLCRILHRFTIKATASIIKQKNTMRLLVLAKFLFFVVVLILLPSLLRVASIFRFS